MSRVDGSIVSVIDRVSFASTRSALVDGRGDVGVEQVEERRARDAEPEAVDRLLQRRDVILRRRARRWRCRADRSRPARSASSPRPRRSASSARSDRATRQRDDAADRDEPVGRLQPDDAAVRRGRADRSAGVGAERAVAQVGRRPPRPSRRTTRRDCARAPTGSAPGRSSWSPTCRPSRTRAGSPCRRTTAPAAASRRVDLGVFGRARDRRTPRSPPSSASRRYRCCP